MKKVYRSLMESIMNIFNFQQKHMMLLTSDQQKPSEYAKLCYIFKESVEDNFV